MTVNRNQINAMSDIIARMNAVESAPKRTPRRADEAYVPSEDNRDGQIKEMAAIMARFREATSNVREEAQTNDMLLEALQTERTPEGVRIAEWEILISESEHRPGKFYDVRRDDITIAADLRLYEAAELLATELNRGSSITSTKIRRILALEAAYAQAFDQAILYSNLVKNADGQRREIAKTKLSEAKTKALAAKNQIREVR